jgi:Domain of unknown function (DUF4386)
MHECGGALSLVIIVLGAIAEGFVANRLIAPGAAATTAHNIMAAPALWQFSVAGDLWWKMALRLLCGLGA